MEKKECTTIKKAKDQKLRDYFERQFQELRKQREDKERLQRSGQRIRSEAELDEIIDGLQVQAMEDQKMRSYAVIPPIMFDSTMKPPAKYDNRNGFIEDPFLLYKEVENINIWTEGEKEIFREKYLQHPKNFGLIASFLERKSVADCVQYYYHSKKKEKYKELLKKHAKKRTRALAKQQQAANAHSAHRGSPMMKDAPEKGGTLKSYVGKTVSATSVILPYATPLNHHSQSVKVKSENEGTRRLKGEPNEAGDAKMSPFTQVPFHGLIPWQGILSSAEGERFMMEQRKRFDQMAAAAAAAAGPLQVAGTTPPNNRLQAIGFGQLRR